MALPRITAPSPNIFGDSATEQIFARGLMDPNIGGLMYGFYDAAKAARAKDQAAYLAGVAAANQLGLQSDMAENATNLAKTRLTEAGKLAAAGVTGTDNLPDLAGIVTTPDHSFADAKRHQMLHAGSGGGGTKFKVEALVGPTGVVTGYKITGGDGKQVVMTAQEYAKMQGEAAKVNPPNKNDPMLDPDAWNKFGTP